MEKFKRLVESHFGYRIGIQSRIFKYVFARACYYDLCKKNNSVSLKTIGQSVGRTHATVLHALRELPYMLLNDEYYKNQYAELQIKANKLIEGQAEKINITQLVVNHNLLIMENDQLINQIKKQTKELDLLLIDNKEMKRIIYIMADTD
jgi:chromosomal replication initiation ATPase DnaA|tara:strand:+ start:276 stop:722 length:447 start_codon:yes stop_codon:yes gene_type:complete